MENSTRQLNYEHALIALQGVVLGACAVNYSAPTLAIALIVALSVLITFIYGKIARLRRNLFFVLLGAGIGRCLTYGKPITLMDTACMMCLVAAVALNLD